MITVIDNKEAAEHYAKRLLTLGPDTYIGLDCETEGVDLDKATPIHRGYIVCWSIYHESVGNLFVPNFTESYLEDFRPWLENPVSNKCGHNIYSFDKHMFHNHGIVLKGIRTDTLRTSKLWNNTQEGHGLKYLLKAYLGMEGYGEYKEIFSRRAVLGQEPGGDIKSSYRTVDGTKVPTTFGGAATRISWRQREFIHLSDIPTQHPELYPTLIKYACNDAEGAAKLAPRIDTQLKTRTSKLGTMYDLYTHVWNPYCDALTRMERYGVGIDRLRSETLSEEARIVIEGNGKDGSERIEGMQERLLKWHPEPINWGSSAQLADLLFDKLKMPRPEVMGSPKAIKRAPEGKWSTSEASLDWLWFRTTGANQEALKEIIALRKAKKFKNDYLDKIPHLAVGSRVHAQFRPSTDTGRLACSKPPLQQIPGRDRFGIRSVFAAPTGRVLCVVDYLQLEVYVLGHMLIKLFNDHSIAKALEGDVYGEMAKQIWPTQLEGIHATEIKHHKSKEIAKLRDYAKIVVLARVYGKTAEGLATSIRDELGEGIGYTKAQELLLGFDVAYPGVARYQLWAADYAQSHKGVPSILGRWRPIPEITAKSKGKKEAGKRKAYNTPIQGSAADIMACALLELDRRIPNDCGIVLNVHDELVVEAPEDKASDILKLVIDCMEHPPYIDLAVQLKAEGKVCSTWGEAK